MIADIPTPGSRAAVEQGCTCAIMDNNRGLYPPYPPDGWWITESCPMHGDWYHGLPVLYIDTTKHPRMRDATIEARRMMADFGCQGCTPGRPRLAVVRLCGATREKDCASPCYLDHLDHDDDDACLRDFRVWCYTPTHRDAA